MSQQAKRKGLSTTRTPQLEMANSLTSYLVSKSLTQSKCEKLITFSRNISKSQQLILSRRNTWSPVQTIAQKLSMMKT